MHLPEERSQLEGRHKDRRDLPTPCPCAHADVLHAFLRASRSADTLWLNRRDAAEGGGSIRRPHITVLFPKMRKQPRATLCKYNYI